ncbi:MAG: hypothetical protein ACE5HC_08645, partial [Candidatus Binatia bacterium]
AAHDRFQIRDGCQERRNNMQLATLNALLKSFCRQDSERDFQMVLSDRKPRNQRGLYRYKERTITLYPRTCDAIEIYGAALHELAHHLLWKRHENSLQRRFHQGMTVPHHGKEFRKILDELLGTFNFHYRELLKGKLVFNKRKPTLPPRFVPFDRNSGSSKSVESGGFGIGYSRTERRK